jgi:hypothetical protein
MLGVGGAEHLASPGPHQLGTAVVHVGGGVQADPRSDGARRCTSGKNRPQKACASWKPIEAHLTIVFAALAVTRFVENATGWSIKRFVRTARRYRTVQIRVGAHTLTAEDPLPPDRRDALAQIN